MRWLESEQLTCETVPCHVIVNQLLPQQVGDTVWTAQHKETMTHSTDSHGGTETSAKPQTAIQDSYQHRVTPACCKKAICKQHEASAPAASPVLGAPKDSKQTKLIAIAVLTAWVRAACCLQLCVPCLSVARFTDFKLLVFLLLELRLVAKHPDHSLARLEPVDYCRSGRLH